MRHEAIPGMNNHDVPNNKQHESDRLVWAPTVNSTNVDNMFRVNQIMTTFSDADSETGKTVFTKLVLQITTQYGR
jgi:hypothetical protein